MLRLLLADESRRNVRPFQVLGSDGPQFIPRLELEKTGWVSQLASSAGVLIRGPVAPRDFQGGPYFRDCWIDQRIPKLGFATAIALQFLLILFPPPIWTVRPARVMAPSPKMELTWYGPVKDLPRVLPGARVPKASPRRDERKTQPSRGADAFHLRQTIISEPLHPTHPRQTLIQPAAPPDAPKILPALPNIVQLARSEPVRPKVQFTSEQLAAMRPKAVAAISVPDAAVPDVLVAEKEVGVINVLSSKSTPAKPLLSVNPMSAPRAAPKKGDGNSAAPDIPARAADNNTLIALSATPGPVAPSPSVPSGNLSARISISPDGTRTGTPGAAVTGGGRNDENTLGGGGRGPEGIFINGRNSTNTAPTSGLGIGSKLPSRPSPRIRSSPGDSVSPRSNSDSAQQVPKLDMPPEKILGAKRVYSLQVNMPNLTSASGSWVLNFAELEETDSGPLGRVAAAELAGPVPLRKVDPRYPPELRTGHVEGEVILYAIIRKDGSVDSIQLVHGVDPTLNANAMDALAQWKFRPAEKSGEPVDLEAVVHIPFRSRVPTF